jgi:hypothetical protein
MSHQNIFKKDTKLKDTHLYLSLVSLAVVSTAKKSQFCVELSSAWSYFLPSDWDSLSHDCYYWEVCFCPGSYECHDLQQIKNVQTLQVYLLVDCIETS